MRSSLYIVSAFFLATAGGIACENGDTPENMPGEFGDACIPGVNQDTPDGCVAGTKCYAGYCEQECMETANCQVVDNWEHVCVAGLCQILCDDNKGCPETLGVSMTCGVIGTSRWCEAKDEES